MGIARIAATFRCDGCDGAFAVDMDPAAKPTKGTLLAEAEDYISGDPTISIQGEHHLCVKCTGIVDNAFDDDTEPTRDEVAKILDEAQVKGLI